MTTQATLGTLQISELTIPVLNDRFHQIQDYVNGLSGMTGPMQFYDNPQLNQTTKTALLPAAATALNGTILIEDASTTFNLIYYAGGNRYRLAGASF